ncbi:hypothetical protein BgiBS90_003965 [Biomphalaria glabrata]|nr:hypothetical protein BgiBS90_003965 [Biomphalaria glabrata]
MYAASKLADGINILAYFSNRCLTSFKTCLIILQDLTTLNQHSTEPPSDSVQMYRTDVKKKYWSESQTNNNMAVFASEGKSGFEWCTSSTFYG